MGNIQMTDLYQCPYSALPQYLNLTFIVIVRVSVCVCAYLQCNKEWESISQCIFLLPLFQQMFSMFTFCKNQTCCCRGPKPSISSFYSISRMCVPRVWYYDIRQDEAETKDCFFLLFLYNTSTQGVIYLSNDYSELWKSQSLWLDFVSAKILLSPFLLAS